MREDAEYGLDCSTRRRTATLRGVVRLDHAATTERLFSVIEADMSAGGCQPYTVDVSAVIFMNSSAIRALASLVLVAKRDGLRLTLIGRDSVPWQNRTLRSLSSLYSALDVRSVATDKPVLRRERELWALETPDGRTFRLKDSKGLAYLELLLCHPGRELHVLELAGVETAGDAGPVLDERAKAQYRARIAELREELAEAERCHDLGRAARAREETDAIAQQLGAAVGLGGRDRRSASDVERARINVQRCLKEALERIGKSDAALGRYLSTTVRTGTYCSFRPL